MTNPPPSPRIPGGGVRRVSKPAPFRRPAVDITRVGREWREVEVATLVPGDIVALLGTVNQVHRFDTHLVINAGQNVLTACSLDARVRAFVRKDQP